MKTNKHGWIQASPTEHMIHYRRGKVLRQGLGMGSWILPVIDRFILIPCTAQNLSFAADQITRENQGVEIAGFAVWKIGRPEITAQRFDFHDPQEPTQKIGVYLKDVVESAIRHLVANMTIEEVLRKRASIILELKRELDYITSQWGLEIDTIEIKNVKIMSGDVFSNLQSGYREELRLSAAVKRLQTEGQIAARKLEQEEEQAKQDAAHRARELERENELCQQQERLKHEQSLEAMRLNEMLQREQFAEEIATLGAKESLLTAHEKIHALERSHAINQKQHELAVSELEAKAQVLGWEADNKRRADLALIDELPALSEKLNVGEVNITPEIIQAVTKLFNRREPKAA